MEGDSSAISDHLIQNNPRSKSRDNSEAASMISDVNYQESGSFRCCSIFSAWPWKRLMKAKTKDRQNGSGKVTPSSTYYRKFSADTDVPLTVGEPAADEKPPRSHDLWKTPPDQQMPKLPTATRTPYTSNRLRHVPNSRKHKSTGSISSGGQLSANIGNFSEFPSDSEGDGLSIDLHDLEKMASWRYSLDTQQEGWWYDYDDLPMMDESCTTLCNNKNVSRESLPIWERDVTGNVVLRRLIKNGKRETPTSPVVLTMREQLKKHEKSPSRSLGSGEADSDDMYIMNRARPIRSVSIRSEEVTLDVVKEEEDVFNAEHQQKASPKKSPTIAEMEESFDSEAEAASMLPNDLSDDVTSLSVSDEAIHSTGAYSSSTELGMLPLELQDEIAAIDNLTRQAELAEELRVHSENGTVKLNTSALYEELYDDGNDTSSSTTMDSVHSHSKASQEGLVLENTDEEETSLNGEEELDNDQADQQLIGKELVLHIPELEADEENNLPDGSDEASAKLQRRLSSASWHRSAAVRKITNSVSDPTGTLHLLAMDNVTL